MAQQRVQGRQLSVNLDDLEDVTVGGPADGDVLTYNSGVWEASPAAGGAAFFDVSSGLASTLTFSDDNNWAFGTSSAGYLISTQGPVNLGTTLQLTASNLFQEYLVTFNPTNAARITNGFTIQFDVARMSGSIGSNWNMTVQLSPAGVFSFGNGSFSMFYQSHSADPNQVDSFHIRDDNNNELIPPSPVNSYIAGDGLWATPTTTRRVTATANGTSLIVTIGGVTAGSFVTGRTYRITTVGTTDFTAIGASANTVGTIFTATGAGTGTGVAEVYLAVTLPQTIALANNKLFRLSLYGGGTAGGGTGPGSPGNTPAEFDNLTITGVPILPTSYQVDASPDHSVVSFPNLRISQALPADPLVVSVPLLNLRDDTNPHGDIILQPAVGTFPNVDPSNDHILQFRNGLRATGTVNGVETIVDSFITADNSPTLQLYHFNNVDGGPNEGHVREELSGAILSSQGFPQVAPGEYGASALHINVQGDGIALLPTYNFPQWTMDFSTRGVSAGPRSEGTFFIVNDATPYFFQMEYAPDTTTWQFFLRNANNTTLYSASGLTYDIYYKWAITVDIELDEFRLYRNGTQVATGPALGATGLFTSGVTTDAPWDMLITPVGGGESGPNDNGIMLDELRLTPRVLYTDTTYVVNTSEFPLTSVFEAATALSFPNLRYTQYNDFRATYEQQQMVIYDHLGNVAMVYPGGDLAVPREIQFNPAEFTVTTGGVDNQTLSISLTGGGGGGGNADVPAYQMVAGNAGGVATITVLNGQSGLTDGVYPGVEFFALNNTVNATALVAGRRYRILTVGTTDFTTVGAANNALNTVFVASGPATGTGTVQRYDASSSVILTLTVAGGSVVSGAITYPGRGFFANDQLTDFNGFGAPGPITFTVNSVTTGSGGVAHTQVDPYTGLFSINYDTENDAPVVTAPFFATGNVGNVQLFGMSARAGDVINNGGSIFLNAGPADYSSEVNSGTVSFGGGYVYRPSLSRNGGYVDVPGGNKGAPTTMAFGSGDIVASLNGVATFTIVSGGTGYTPGTYNAVSLTGGGGDGAFFDVVVNGSGVVTTVTCYSPGYGFAVNDVLTDPFNQLGAGTGFSIQVTALTTFGTTNGIGTLDYINGFSKGSGYTPGEHQVALVGGTGTGANAFVMVDSNGEVSGVSLGDPGNGYTVGDTLTAGTGVGPGTGFSIDVLTTVTESEPVTTGSINLSAGQLFLNGGTVDDITGVLELGSITMNAGFVSNGTPFGLNTGYILFRTSDGDRLKLTSGGPWEVNGNPGDPGQVLTSFGTADAPEWRWSDALMALIPDTGSDGVFDGSLFSTWDGTQTSDQYSSAVASLDSSIQPGDILIPFTGRYEVRVEVVATPTTPADWPTGETIYGTELTFPLNDPALVWQRKQHARFVDVAGTLDGTQRWTDVYHVNVWTQLNDYGNGALATALVAGQDYRIAVPGTTNWVAVGAADNNVGTIFNATGAGTGTGIADGGNFLMRVNAFAESTAGTESVRFDVRVAVRPMGPGVAPA